MSVLFWISFLVMEYHHVNWITVNGYLAEISTNIVAAGGRFTLIKDVLTDRSGGEIEVVVKSPPKPDPTAHKEKTNTNNKGMFKIFFSDDNPVKQAVKASMPIIVATGIICLLVICWFRGAQFCIKYCCPCLDIGRHFREATNKYMPGIRVGPKGNTETYEVTDEEMEALAGLVEAIAK